MQSVKTGVTVTYRLNPAGLVELRRQIGTDDPENHQLSVIQPQLQESIKAITARYKADELLANRTEVRQEMQALLQEKLDNVLSEAFVVVEFAITDFSFSKAFDNAIEAKVKAEQSALRSENEVREAEAEAQKRIATARGEAESLRIQAEAEAEAERIRAVAEADAIRLRAAALRENPEVLKLNFVRSWDGRLPLVISGESSGLMLGIDGVADIESRQ